MAENEIILGYDVGGTKLGIGLASSDGKILGKDRIENKDTYPEDILPQMAEKGRRLVADAGLKMSDVKGFGISAPGPADIANGVLTAPTNNVHWRNVPIQSYLENELQIKGCFENDANCAALAEWFFGAGRGCHDFIYLTMSTGIGGGIAVAAGAPAAIAATSEDPKAFGKSIIFVALGEGFGLYGLLIAIMILILK